MELIVIVVAAVLILAARHVIYRSETEHVDDGPRVYCVYPSEHRACIDCQRQGRCAAAERGSSDKEK
jgi:hypothetical protein